MSQTDTQDTTAVQESDFGHLGNVARDRLQRDRDIKIIIIGEDSQTGIGKTTLAILLCRYIGQHDWQADEKAFIDVQKYLNAFLDYPKGCAFLLDEIEHGADSRRATSTENVELSQGWAKLRARNMATIATLPSTDMLDPRMTMLADFIVIVRRRGVAQPYKIKVNDFSGKVQYKPFPGDEHIKFSDLPDGDNDKQYLDKIKDEAVRGESLERITMREHERRQEKAIEQAKSEKRNELIKSFYHRFEDISQYDIADLDAIDISRDRVGQIVRNG